MVNSGDLQYLAAAAVIFPSFIWYLRKNIVSPVKLHLGKPQQGGKVEAERQHLLERIQKKCPSLFDPAKAKYESTPWLLGGHLQTVYAAVANFDNTAQVEYERTLVSTPDGGTISVDWCPSSEIKPYDDTPTVVILHGLTGGSHESYVRQVVESMTQGPGQFRTVVVNFRGCADTQLTSTQLYSGAYTDDLRIALKFIQDRIPKAKLAGLGFSLGSNVLVKYIGEEKENCPFVGAVSVSNPFDLYLANKWMDETFINRNLYSKSLTDNLLRVFKRHMHHFENTGLLDIPHVLKSRRISEFDDRVTRVVFKYDTVDDYYRDASCARFIPDVRVPLLCLNAIDDPVAYHECIPYEACRNNPNVILATTETGGHIGWFTGSTNVTRWSVKPISEFLTAVLE
ncbi:AB-hydrolase YheT [Basidiobolus meristosporus CBS 931.73]|uniref:AB-hydrolase YheT n=1 Tax=Basidiobolus meristosporus CBS 931.73 TaxID=1314790 RepID=A0A1Y1WZN8_9FUNG|nr:AB-hydrolase YheT [Basidiobolus meristosporus CBS 931.73]|eukprot:ORX78855.1 AB-hydrolase YheT [Basidiobolus meristosporus CBS 931.73]